MITKITSTPFVSAGKFYTNKYSKNNQNIYAQKDLKTDTVTFTASNKQINEAVNLAFQKLNQVRKNGKLANYYGTTKNNINVALRETSYGKTAEVSLSNGNFGTKSFVNYEIIRSAKENSSIISESGKPARNAAKLIKTCLDDLK